MFVSSATFNSRTDSLFTQTIHSSTTCTPYILNIPGGFFETIIPVRRRRTVRGHPQQLLKQFKPHRANGTERTGSHGFGCTSELAARLRHAQFDAKGNKDFLGVQKKWNR